MKFYQFFKNIYHLLQAVFSGLFFWFPSRKIRIIGVTGTNGKTTTVWMINKILEEAGFTTAVSSTINFKIGGEDQVNKTKLTTLSAWKVQQFIRKAVNARCRYLILETSSHALDQNRVWGVGYDVAVITNVTREHLDYHRTMEEYKSVKLGLFKNLNDNFKIVLNSSILKTKKSTIVNLAMNRAEEFLAVEAENKWGYKLEAGNEKLKTKFKSKGVNVIEAKNIKLESNSSNFKVSGLNFRLNFPGEFNIENALAAICVGLSRGINLKICCRALEKIEKIPGRMDYVKNDRGLKIVIDYALTPDSMEKLGRLINEIKDVGSKVIWVFGACGERDRGKRPIMGSTGEKYADVVIITNEDPYGEDPEEIMDEILSGIVKDYEIEAGANFKSSPKFQITNKSQNQNNKLLIRGEKIKNSKNTQVFKIIDRREAIRKALEIAQKGDAILITGKGAEEIMMVGKKRIPWNDRKVVDELLEAKN